MNRRKEVQAKVESLRAWIDDSDLDAVLITSHGGFAWVTGGGENGVSLGAEAGVASILVTRDDAYLLAAIMSSINARNLETVLVEVLATRKDGTPPSAVIESLLRWA